MINSRDYLLISVQSIVQQPENVDIVLAESSGMSETYVIKTAKRDVGIVIGKNGSTINALRTIIHVMGYQNSMRINLQVQQ